MNLPCKDGKTHPVDASGVYYIANQGQYVLIMAPLKGGKVNCSFYTTLSLPEVCRAIAEEVWPTGYTE